MPLPYHIATLLYCFNRREQALLLRRAQEPNLGLWSPCGGKLRMDAGESPYACACREAREETGLDLTPADLADVFVRGQAAFGESAAAASGGGIRVFRL